MVPSSSRCSTSFQQTGAEAVELRPGRHRVRYSVITRAELFAGSSASEHDLAAVTRDRKHVEPIRGVRLRTLR